MSIVLRKNFIEKNTSEGKRVHNLSKNMLLKYCLIKNLIKKNPMTKTLMKEKSIMRILLSLITTL